MLTEKQMDELIAEWRVQLACAKTGVYAEFLSAYGEHADWEEWLDFLQERPELEGFDWARNLAHRHVT